MRDNSNFVFRQKLVGEDGSVRGGVLDQPIYKRRGQLPY